MDVRDHAVPMHRAPPTGFPQTHSVSSAPGGEVMSVWDETWTSTNDGGGIVTTIAGERGQAVMPAIFITVAPSPLCTRESQAERLHLAAQAPAMARLLLKLQWSGRDGRDNDAACPECGGWESIGDHEPDCELVKVLKAAGVIE